jgi:predicted ester cyclase
MTTQTEVERIAERIDAFWTERRFDLAEEFVADDFVGHLIGDDDLQGRAAYRAWAEEDEEMFPDDEIAFEPTFVAGDVHCGRWTLRGTQEGDLPTIDVEPTARRSSFRGCSSTGWRPPVTATWTHGRSCRAATVPRFRRHTDSRGAGRRAVTPAQYFI